MSSILNDTKLALGLLPEMTAFDPTIIMHINSVFLSTRQLGAGPLVGMRVTDAADQWGDFFAENVQDAVQSYVYLRVRLLLDPPQIGFVIASMDRQIQELEFRILIEVDPITPEPTPIIDGGEL